MKGRYAIDHSGQKFGQWTVLSRALNEGTRTKWLCRCACGTEKAVNTYSLCSGRSQSCGCTVIHGHTHGHEMTPTYKSWVNMKQRCANPQTYGYQRYGGRGIKVCDRWLDSFENFLADMGERPEGYTISRLDHDAHYEPSNCEWAPKGSH